MMRVKQVNIFFVSIFIILILIPSEGKTQSSAKVDTTHRLRTTILAASTFYAGTIAYSYYSWYKDTPNSKFHWHNDNSSWLQLDKFGHTTTSYVFSEYSYNVLRWAGLDNKKAAIYGALIGFGSLTSIEIFDGFHSIWGASWGDLIADACGPLLFSSQQIAWKEQRMRIKFSYLPSNRYAPLNPSILGDNHFERIISDYNSQTYWLSVNMASFLPLSSSRFPKWLNLAFGYGGQGLAVSPQYDDSGDILPDYIRTREYSLSLDVDLTKIPTHSKPLKILFKVASFIKIPFPRIGYDSVDKFGLYWI